MNDQTQQEIQRYIDMLHEALIGLSTVQLQAHAGPAAALDLLGSVDAGERDLTFHVGIKHDALIVQGRATDGAGQHIGVVDLEMALTRHAQGPTTAH